MFSLFLSHCLYVILSVSSQWNSLNQRWFSCSLSDCFLVCSGSQRGEKKRNVWMLEFDIHTINIEWWHNMRSLAEPFTARRLPCVCVGWQEQLSRQGDESVLQKVLEESKREMDAKGGVWKIGLWNMSVGWCNGCNDFWPHQPCNLWIM